MEGYLSEGVDVGIIFRKSFRLGPFRLNFTKSGFSSWIIRFGKYSWNSRARAHRVDLPGPLSWTSRRRQRRADSER